MLIFLATPCLAVTVQPCMEWIPIKKEKENVTLRQLWFEVIRDYAAMLILNIHLLLIFSNCIFITSNFLTMKSILSHWSTWNTGLLSLFEIGLQEQKTIQFWKEKKPQVCGIKLLYSFPFCFSPLSHLLIFIFWSTFKGQKDCRIFLHYI